MPAQSTSADKKLQAQQARRQAALKSANHRRGRKKTPNSGAGAAPEPLSATVSSAPEKEPEGLFPLTEVAAVNAVTLSEGTDDAGSPELDMLCEVADTNPSALGANLNNVRQLCRNRRKAMSTRGKAAIPAKNGRSGSGSNAARAMAYAAGQINGRDLAKLRRQEMASKGRGDSPASRPSGRIRPNSVPPKVETGTTLSGQEVTGTQVERTVSVTGNEPGTCRPVTGTEYVGSEQFSTFCGTQPEPNTPKVGMSITGAGRPVTGTEVGQSEKVTGDEQGSCVNVTGSEYVGADKLADFCGIQPSPKPAKVMSGRTQKKDVRLTGADEARFNSTTGNESGAQNHITGSQYADMGLAKMTINGPSKVALTHTIAGQPVTGTEVGRSAKVTGDEYGSCRPVTGTEYLSTEQFASVCGTVAEPHPAKVGVDSSRQGQRITGALVDRSANVTGNEPGSCSHLTGTQYGSSNLCGGAAPKVNNMHTLSGNHLTGNSVDLSPKMTGDEQGGCLPVTGIEYYGQEQFAQCSSTPQAAPAKVGFDHTPKGEHVSGTMLGAVANVTGNEQGVQLPVSGTPYSGVQIPQDHGACCSSCAARNAAEAAGLIAPAAAALHQTQMHQQQPVPQQQMQPAPVQAQQYPVQQAAPAPAPATARDFSIVSPARAAQVTGSSYGGNRVTGPGDLAGNRVSGTPEFRYPQAQQQYQQPQPQPMAAPEQSVQMVQPAAPVGFAPAATQPVAAMQPDPVAQQAQASQRITGEGREDGIAVTGDNWGRVPGMTGTEGHVAQGRNQSLLAGQMQQQPINNAHYNKELERPVVPAARVTGSSGNSNDGAVITVSGGARG